MKRKGYPSNMLPNHLLLLKKPTNVVLYLTIVASQLVVQQNAVEMLSSRIEFLVLYLEDVVKGSITLISS
jgi:hypothetical protein